MSKINKLLLLGILATLAQHFVCYNSADVFGFFYQFDLRISSKVFNLKDYELSLKSIVLFFFYYIFVLHSFVILNLFILVYFFRLNRRFNPNYNLKLMYILSFSPILAAYIIGASLWGINLALHGFPTSFPDNIWKSFNIMLNPHHPPMILFLLIGNVIFFFIFNPIYYWIRRKWL